MKKSLFLNFRVAMMRRLCLIGLFLALSAVAFGQSPDSLKTLIYAHIDNGEYVEAIRYLWMSEAYYKQENDLFNLAGCYSTLGYSYQRTGQFEEAIQCYNQCAQYMDELKENSGNPSMYERNIRYTRNNIAGIYIAMEEYDQCEQMYLKCLDELGTPKDTIDYLDQSTYYGNLVNVYLAQMESMPEEQRKKKLAECVDMAEQAVELSKRYGDMPSRCANRMISLAESYAAVGRMDEAFEVAAEAMAIAEAENDLLLKNDINILYGDLYQNQADFKKAVEWYDEAIRQAEAGHFDEQRLVALNHAYEACKNYDAKKALAYYERWEALKTQIFNERQQQLIRDYQVRYELNEKDHQLQIQQEKNRQNRHLLLVLSLVIGLLLILLLVWIRLNRLKKVQNRTLTKMNGLKDNLLQVVSHDVKTSIFAQNLVLDQLYQHADSMSAPELKGHLFQLKTSSDALKYKLTNIIQWIVSELGTKESHPVLFKLDSLVRSCVAIHEAELNSKQLSMDIDIPADLECYDDATVVSFVMQNLLSNAIKFSGPQGKIHIGWQEEQEKVWVSLTDHGMGIPADKLKMLTKDLVSPSVGTAGEKGTGLGLLVCQRLLERNGAEIRVESVEGEGTTVRFTINK